METRVKGSCGLGLGTTWTACGTFYGHSGSVHGTRSRALIAPDGELVILLADNLRRESEPGAEARAVGLVCAAR
jgi:hypothetical protein